MNQNLLRIAANIANDLPPEVCGPYPGLIVCFDGDYFAGILPVANWNNVFAATAQALPYDAAVLICFEPAPPVDVLRRQALECNVNYDGAIHDRPVKLIGLQYTLPAATGTAGLLH